VNEKTIAFPNKKPVFWPQKVSFTLSTPHTRDFVNERLFASGAATAAVAFNRERRSAAVSETSRSSDHYITTSRDHPIPLSSGALRLALLDSFELQKKEIKKFLSRNPRAIIEPFWGSKSSSCTVP